MLPFPPKFVAGGSEEMRSLLLHQDQAGQYTSTSEQYSFTHDEVDLSNSKKSTQNRSQHGKLLKNVYNLLYCKPKGVADMSGGLYEVKVATLLFVRGLRLGTSFYLATNLADAGLFDDIIFKYKEPGPDEAYTVCFLQLKHKKSDGRKAIIKESDILALKGDFSLPKYCKSYSDLKKKLASQNDHVIFREKIDSCIFAIYTNASMDKHLPLRITTYRALSAEKILGSGGNMMMFNEQDDQYLFNYFKDIPRYLKFLQDLKSGIYLNDTNKKIEEFSKTVANELALKLTGLKNNFDSNKIEHLIHAVQHLGDISDYSEFLSKLLMFTSQANEREIDEIIKAELQDTLMTTKTETAAIFKELIENMHKWWKYDNFYLSEETPFWRNIVQTRVDRISQINDIKRRELTRLGIQFKSVATQRIRDVLKSNHLVNIVSDAESTALSCLKVHQVLEEKKLGFLLVGMETLVRYEKDVLSLWPSKWCPVLVIDCDGFLQNLDKMWDLIFNVVEVDGKHKALVVSESQDNISDSSVRQRVEENFVKVVDKLSFEHLSCESQNTLLNKTTVRFQGAPVPLHTIIEECCVLSDSINVHFMSQLIHDDYNLKIGEQLEDVISYYIPRVMDSCQCINTTILATNPIDFSGVIAVSGYTAKDLLKYVPKGTEIRTLQLQDCSDVCESPSQRIRSDGHKQEKEETTKTEFDVAQGAQKRRMVSSLIRKESAQCFSDIILTRHESESSQSQCCSLFIIDNEQGFHELCQYHTNVHWLAKHEQNGAEVLKWVKSQGDVDIIYQHLNKTIKTVYNKLDNVMSTPDRLTLIVAEAGMGKSTLLTHMAMGTKQSDPGMWVIRVNLNDYTNYLDKIDPQTYDMEKTFNFLCMAANTESVLEMKLLEYFFKETGNMAVFLDGYDEISPTHAEKAGVILECLCQSKVKKLWVTSRPIMRNFLEKILSTFAYTLRPFSADDQKCFIFNFWMSRISNLNRNNDNIAQRLFKLSSKFLDGHFMGIPLQTMMLAEACENHVSTFKNLPENLNLLELYDKFVEKKVEIYCKEKKKVDTTIPGVKEDNEYWHNLFLENHILASMTTLFPPSKYGHLYTIDTKIKMDIFMTKIEEGHEKTGIINNVVDSQHQFIHRTFADYFVGKCLSFRFSPSDKYNSIHHSLTRYFTKTMMESIYEMIFEHDFDFVRNILDSILARDLPLHSAIINHDKASIQMLLENGEGVNLRDRGGRTPLHLAACYCSNINKKLESYKTSDSCTDNLLEKLVNSGADINVTDDVLHWRPLRYADKMKAWDVIEYFLQNKGTTEDLIATKLEASKRRNKQDVLYIAASKGYVKLLQFILQTKLSSSERAQHYFLYENYTPLRTAVKNEQWDVLKVLVSNHIDINGKHGEGDTILHWAARQGKPEAITKLVELGADINIRNNFGNTPLHCAARNGSLSVVTTIVSLGGNVSIVNNDGNTALYQAAGQGMWHVVNHLLHLGSNINIGSSIGNTPLHWAAEKGELDIIRQLVQSHADINIRNNGGNTPLHWAVWKGTEESIKVLVQLGAQINVRNNQLETPMYWAAKQNKWNKVKTLIDLGADVNIGNGKGNMPLHWAAKYGTVEIIKHLAALSSVDVKNNHGNCPLHFAAGNGKCELITQLVELGATVNIQNNVGNTPLHWAVGEDKKDAIRLLVQLKADTRSRNIEGNSPLHIAAGQKRWEADERFLHLNMDTNAGSSRNKLVYRFYGNDNVDLVKLLIGLGSNRNAHNKKRETALHRAAYLGNLNVVKYLTQVKVLINARNTFGMTPLDLAFKREKIRQAIIKELQEQGATRGNFLSRLIPVIN
ncbi:uncharacterized protein [Periplaneta americana]|uniref:uncharacterized protein n=1 Tax=Periplaneta americana TaxID=6978 RepID=UPI0037E8089E